MRDAGALQKRDRESGSLPGGDGRVAAGAADHRPLIVHVLYRFDTGGLENGVVNLVNRLPATRFRHTIVALDKVVPEFLGRITRSDVGVVSLHKPPGQTARLYPRLFRLFRALRPAVVHTRNLAALECQPPAWLAGVPVRIHGEHGRDVADLDGSNRLHQWNRRAMRPFVQHWVALSSELRDYLAGPIGVPPARLTRICNGVDSLRFRAAAGPRPPIAGCPFTDPGLWLVGTVGRMQTVKNQTALAQAFVQLLQRHPALRERVRLVMVGEGPLRARSQELLDTAGLGDLAWLPGERSDVADVMRGLDCFVLPSLAEGISNTILEAMSSGLPVLATDVGGNADLVDPGRTGLLVAAEAQALAGGLERLAADPAASAAMGRAGRARVEREFSLDAMVTAYQGLYDSLLARHADRI
jgi:sugar transferase (PEP-CTERM/EpsH1 system associated)